MKEFVGRCKNCEKDIYCLDGFLNGIILENHEVLCFECEKEELRENRG
jgi:hypothetical protein